MDNTKIIGFVDVNFDRYWSSSVLGKTFDVVIDKIPMKIHFPGLPKKWEDKSKKDVLHYPLSSPQIVDSYKCGDDKIFYGLPHSYPAGSSMVEKIVVSFDLQKTEIEGRISLIHSKIEKAINKLYKLCYIVNQDIILSAKVEQSDCCIELYNDSLGERIQINKEIILHGYVHNDSNSITKKQLKIMLDIISKDIDIPIEYNFLISGIKAYENHDNRKCILDLSTACEIAVTSKIEEIQNKLNIRNLLEDYKMLSAKYKLLGLLNFDISFADIKVVTEARNKAIHKGTQVDNKRAYEAINVTRTILSKLSKFY